MARLLGFLYLSHRSNQRATVTGVQWLKFLFPENWSGIGESVVYYKGHLYLFLIMISCTILGVSYSVLEECKHTVMLMNWYPWKKSGEHVNIVTEGK
ncbi:hypothetical protein BO86DRAFT_194956 [Aspergillus japonicus CBS 114.51]|uniref:Uncharacterized protein n=1 Tax=Aspergillus japonicus CBS 114.51 TaxID=1448312 RepID=A0A8T8WS61_ASPJA|nr:hypothetical protein BO86DRAFT_194956 [Aspergillus japonicus CBS 114.51]RAH78169.1 hypothetical protein BO86DRAFT_194956 [Aspergillus japonicus CBS 114.51]